MIIAQIKKLKINYIMLIFAACMLLLHIKCYTNLGDDAVHSSYLEKMSIFERAYELYFNVNGKVLPDLAAAIFTYIPSIFWRIVDVGMYLIIALCIYNIFLAKGEKHQYNLLSCCVMSLFLPLSLIESTGYVAGTTNYIWSGAMLLVAFLPFKKAFCKDKIKKWEYIVFLFATVYACNQEQSMALLIVLSLLIICYCWIKKKRLNKYIYVQTIFAGFCMLLMFLSPGHQARADSFSIFRIPNYPMLNIIDKLHLGITSTCSHFIGNFQYIFAFFSILLFLNVKEKNRDRFSLCFGALPLLWNVILLAFQFLCDRWPILSELFCSHPYNSYGLSDFGYITPITYQNFLYYVPIVISIIIGIAVLVDIMMVFNSFEMQMISSLILIGGFVSRIVMGLSPTLYGSSFRTFSFMYMSLIIVSAMLLKEYSMKDNDNVLLIIAATMAGMGM